MHNIILEGKLKKIEKINRIVNSILIIVFILICLITPKDFLGLKKLTFFILIFYNSSFLIKKKYNKFESMLLFYGTLFPIITICLSIMVSGDIIKSIIMGYVPFLTLLFFIIRRTNINYEKYIVNSILLIVVFLNVIVLLDSLKLINLNYLIYFLKGIGSGSFGKNEVFSFTYKLYFASSPLFVIAFFYYFYKKKYLFFFLTSVALVVSGTRANVIFPALFLLLYLLFSYSLKFTIKFVTIILVSVLILLNFQTIYKSIVEKNEVSDGRRVAHIEGYKNILENDLSSLILGQGYGSGFKSDAYNVGGEVHQTEFSHFEILRQNGIIIFFIFSIFIIYPISYLRFRKEDYYLYAYSTYQVICTTNPLLFNSTGYLMIIYAYYKINDYNKMEAQIDK